MKEHSEQLISQKIVFGYFIFNLLESQFKPLIILLFSFMLLNISKAQTTIPLYKQIPNSRPALDYKEKSDTGSDGVIRISKVSVPEITIFQPKKSSRKNTAIIICPGGGYSILAYNLEGTNVAKILNDWGITAVVLKYRLPMDVIMKDKSIGPLQDAQRALQYLRENAEQLNINPKSIGIMGFSAGGHLAATAATHFGKAYIDNPHNISLRPDFSILAYPVISFNDLIGHLGSRDNLIGKNPLSDLINNFSTELQVTEKTPPTFLVLAGDDDVVNPENSIKYYEALLKNHVPAEMHIYQNGGHGFGTKINWMPGLKLWMEHNHFL
ncbi:MAG: alpha/beta hydrolase [Bacteroidota bacterium]|nr:alpha/beta hydrolase [Bacteroidota bacterium]